MESMEGMDTLHMVIMEEVGIMVVQGIGHRTIDLQIDQIDQDLSNLSIDRIDQQLSRLDQQQDHLWVDLRDQQVDRLVE